MKIICLDGKEFNVKHQQRAERISNDFGTALYNFPDFVGSKLYHNSTSSDKYTLLFGIHESRLVSFKNSIKKTLFSESDAIENETYGKLTHLILEHPKWGAIFGSIIGSIVYNTGLNGDIMCSCTFAEHTPDGRVIKKDFEDETTSAIDGIDAETTANFNTDLSAQDKSVLESLSDGLEAIYENIQNSAVTSAFNDLNTELSKATLDSLRVMNSFKKIVELPNEVTPDVSSSLALLKEQADLVVSSPVSSYNLTLFNANLLAYNTGIASKSVFVSDAALDAAGVSVVPLT